MAAVLRALPLLLAWVVVACAGVAPVASLPPDAPEARVLTPTPPAPPHSYAEALKTWRGADDLDAWIGASFAYDAARAVLLSESARAASGRRAVLEPGAFFAAPRGVCVDLARFAVETLRVVDPASQPAYLMIEFAPLTVAGQTYRRHWLAMIRRPEGSYFLADSKRPGHRAGPYASVDAFVREYAQYRGRELVSYRVLDSFERRVRSRAARQNAEPMR